MEIRDSVPKTYWHLLSVVPWKAYSYAVGWFSLVFRLIFLKLGLFCNVRTGSVISVADSWLDRNINLCWNLHKNSRETKHILMFTFSLSPPGRQTNRPGSRAVVGLPEASPGTPLPFFLVCCLGLFLSQNKLLTTRRTWLFAGCCVVPYRASQELLWNKNVTQFNPNSPHYFLDDWWHASLTWLLPLLLSLIDTRCKLREGKTDRCSKFWILTRKSQPSRDKIRNLLLL